MIKIYFKYDEYLWGKYHQFLDMCSKKLWNNVLFTRLSVCDEILTSSFIIDSLLCFIILIPPQCKSATETSFFGFVKNVTLKTKFLLYSLCKTTINVPGKLVFGFLMLKFKTGEITQLRPALYTFAFFNLIKIISFLYLFFSFWGYTTI